MIYVVWANIITPKRSTGKSPFQLVYGKDAIFPINLAFPVLKFLQDSTDEPNDFFRRVNQIIELNENRDEVQYKLNKYNNKMKILFDRRAKERDFKEGDLVLDEMLGEKRMESMENLTIYSLDLYQSLK